MRLLIRQRSLMMMINFDVVLLMILFYVDVFPLLIVGITMLYVLQLRPLIIDYVNVVSY